MDKRNKALEVEQNEISNATSTDYFIYSHFLENGSCPINSRQIRYAENISEAASYIHHIILYDILNDLLDDIKYDFKMPFSKKQTDAIAVMSFWFKFGKAYDKSEKEILQLCNDFNNQFAYNKNLKYEIDILNGADELKNFFNVKYEKSKEFDKYKLEAICSKDSFNAKELKSFIDKLLNT